ESMHPIRLRSVVLPLPDGPTIMANRCLGISKVTPLTAVTSSPSSWYALTTSWNRTTCALAASCIAFLQACWYRVVPRRRSLRYYVVPLQVASKMTRTRKLAAPAATEREDELRRRIRRATFELLTKHGYGRTSTREIASRAKVSKRELY